MSMKQLQHEAFKAWLQTRSYYRIPFRVFWRNYQLSHAHRCCI